MDDRPEWERQLDAAEGDVDRSGDIVPASQWRLFTDGLRAPQRVAEPGSYAARHKLETGHDFAAGCCLAA